MNAQETPDNNSGWDEVCPYTFWPLWDFHDGKLEIATLGCSCPQSACVALPQIWTPRAGHCQEDLSRHGHRGQRRGLLQDATLADEEMQGPGAPPKEMGPTH